MLISASVPATAEPEGDDFRARVLHKLDLIAQAFDADVQQNVIAAVIDANGQGCVRESYVREARLHWQTADFVRELRQHIEKLPV